MNEQVVVTAALAVVLLVLVVLAVVLLQPDLTNLVHMPAQTGLIR